MEYHLAYACKEVIFIPRLDITNDSPFVYANLVEAAQFSEGNWNRLDAWIGKHSEWEQFSKKEIMPPIGSPLDAFTWSQIDRIGKGGLARDYFSLGEVKRFTIGPRIYELELIAFDHDDLADGSGKAPYTFLMKILVDSIYPMNDRETNAGGYNGSNFYRILNDSIYPTFNEDLRTVVKPIFKKTSSGSRSDVIVITTETAFMPSEIEICGTSTIAFPGEGEHYTRFSTAPQRMKYAALYDTNNTWFLRSPDRASTTDFAAIGIQGVVARRDADLSTGIAIGLCI